MSTFGQHFQRFWRPCSIVLWFLLFQLLFASVLPLFLGLNQVMSTIFVSLLANLAIITIIVWRQHVNINDLRCQISKGTIGLWALLMLSVAISVNILEEWLDVPDMLQDVMIAIMHQPLGILAVAIIGPVAEELVFRGSLMGGLMRNGYSTKTAILISSILFGVIHFNPIQILFAGLIGLLLGWAYYKTKSLTPCIIMHIANNSFAVLTMFLSDDPTAKMSDTMPFAALIALLGTTLVASFLLIRYLNK